MPIDKNFHVNKPEDKNSCNSVASKVALQKKSYTKALYFAIGAATGIATVSLSGGILYLYAQQATNNQNLSSTMNPKTNKIDDQALNNTYNELTNTKKDEVLYVPEYSHKDITEGLHEISNGYIGRLGNNYKAMIKK